jgi:hypothetical protein
VRFEACVTVPEFGEGAVKESRYKKAMMMTDHAATL